MTPFLSYIIKVAFVYLLCFILYWALFRKETFFTRNRIYLLLSLIIPALIPLVRFPGISPVADLAANQGMGWMMMVSDTFSPTADVGVMTSESGGMVPSTRINIGGLVIVIYLAGLTFFFVRMLRNYSKVINLIARSQRRRLMKMILVITRNKVSPFSLFRWLVIPEQKQNHPDLDKIIRHEMIHYRQKHSVDLLLSEVLIAFQWFNPFAWMLKSAIVKNNEFIVDQQLAQDQIDLKAYQYALLTSSVGERQLAMVNGFNRGLIKKRIEMMNKKETPLINRIKNTLILPFALILIVGFSAYSPKTTETTPVPQERKVVKEQEEIKERKVVSEHPVHRRERKIVGQDKKKDTLKNHISIYIDGKMITLKNVDELKGEDGEIQIMKLSEIEGLKGEFSKEKLGAIIKKIDTDEDNTILMVKRSKKEGDAVDVFMGTMSRGETEEGEEAIIYLENLDDDIRIYSTEGKIKTLYVSEKDGNKTNIFISPDKSDKGMLYLIDGDVVTADELSDLDSKKIYSISIIDSEKAIKKYGEKAKGGAIEIKTKK